MTLNITKDENTIKVNVGSYDSAGPAAILASHSAFGLTLDGSVDAVSARTLLKAAPANRSNNYEVFNPAFTRKMIAGGDGLYRHEATGCQSADGKLHAFYAGNPSSSSESASGQVVYHTTSSDGGVTWTTPTPVYQESSTNTLTPTATQAIQRCKAVGNEVWLFFGNRGTAGQEALIWGRLSASGIWTWARLLVDSSNNLSWSTTDLSGSPVAGYTLTMNILGDICTLTPTSILARGDGGVDLLLIGTTSFGATHHMFLTRMNSSGVFTLVGFPIPSGEDYTPDAWEGSLVATPEGGYVVHARRLLVYGGLSSIPLEGGKRNIRAESPDGISWTAWETTGFRTHSSKASVAALSTDRWVCACSASWSTRNDVVIGITSDPRAFVMGPLASDEDITTNYAEYPEVFTYTYNNTKKIGVLYSGRTQVSVAPNEIRWATCDVPTTTNFLAQVTSQRANRSDSTAVSTSSGNTIIVPPKASMSWEPTPYQVERKTIPWSVSVVPGGVPYILASIGNYQCWSQVYLTTQNSSYVLKVDGQVIGEPITDPTKPQALVIEVDKRAGVVRVMGHSTALSWQGIVILSGDAYDNTGFSSGAAGNIVIDVSKATVTEPERLAYASVASIEGGPNQFINPEFAIDQRFEGASYGNGVGDKLDMVYLADNGGCGLSIARGSFSLSAATNYTGGVQTHLAITRVSAGTSAPQFDFYLGDLNTMAGKQCMIEFDAFDANGLSYYVEVYAVHNFGSGGSTTFTQRLGVIFVDGFNGRRHGVECFWPTIGSVTTGADSFCALQLRPAFHNLASNGSLRITRLDPHYGKVKRPFQRIDYGMALSDCKQYFQSIVATEAFANFGIGTANTTSSVRITLDRGYMRKPPVLTYTNAFQLVGNVSQTVTSLSASRQTGTQTEVNLNVSGTPLTQWASYQVRDDGTNTAALYLSSRYR